MAAIAEVSEVFLPVMPFGVEQMIPLMSLSFVIGVFLPVMPIGVEQTLME